MTPTTRRLALRTTILLGALVLAALPSPAFADVKEDYMAACMEASGDNTELCTCKTEQASMLVDEETMGYIVIALKEPAKFSEMITKGEVPKAVVDAWPYYVMKSNKACVPPAN